MDKNTLYAILLSTGFLIVWFMFFQPKPKPAPAQTETAAVSEITKPVPAKSSSSENEVSASQKEEQEITVETAKYKAVFTTLGAAVKHWYFKEKSGQLVDLVNEDGQNQFVSFPGSNFEVQRPNDLTLIFTHTSLLGWKVTKTYALSDAYLHNLSITTEKIKDNSQLPVIDIPWGLGTDLKGQKDNISQTRALGFIPTKPSALDKFKPGDYSIKNYLWAAVDNRYFLAALIPLKDSGLSNISVSKVSKKYPPMLSVSAAAPGNSASQTCSLMFYLGPKGREHLKSFNLGLEESIDFGYFGFLGKIALEVLNYFHRMTGNYGWAIIILTILLQLLVLPLTVKSFKASAAMKQLQPLVKELQDKYKADPKRLNVEVLNLYKTYKVNPLGGCLPMVLQLPIFWALFTTLRNAFELRGAGWILWIKDLSATDTFITISGFPVNILPLIMGVGMFFQQKMMSVSADPAQQQMTYIMPVVFTFMFYSFPSGLVIYWLTNSILTMVEQYLIMQKQPALSASGK